MFWKPRKSIEVTSLRHSLANDLQSFADALGKNVEYRPTTVRSTSRLFVIDFRGDVMATQAENLTHEVTAILNYADKNDEVLVRLESPGGAAHAYGFASSQLDRIRKAGIKLTIAVDKVAASGGYMMACVGDEIIAAPFAIIGSIGVVSEFLNFYDILKSLGVNYQQYTAGKYKRTISPLGKITEEGEMKFKEGLNDMYALFKEHVSRHRPKLDIEAVATGEHWSAIKAIDFGLVDRLETSEEYINRNLMYREVLRVKYVGNAKSFGEKIAESFSLSIVNAFIKLVEYYNVYLKLSV
jgi:serine protease SohB